MTHDVPPGIQDQVAHEWNTFGTISDQTITDVADVVRADDPRLRGAGPLPDWVIPLVRKILEVLLSLIPGAGGNRPPT